MTAKSLKWDKLVLILIFYWSIAELQCVNYCFMVNDSYTYIYVYMCVCIYTHTYTHIRCHILFHQGVSQDIEYNSLCYRVGPWYLSILYIPVASVSPKLPIYTSLTPCSLGNHQSIQREISFKCKNKINIILFFKLCLPKGQCFYLV